MCEAYYLLSSQPTCDISLCWWIPFNSSSSHSEVGKHCSRECSWSKELKTVSYGRSTLVWDFKSMAMLSCKWNLKYQEKKTQCKGDLEASLSYPGESFMSTNWIALPDRHATRETLMSRQVFSSSWGESCVTILLSISLAISLFSASFLMFCFWVSLHWPPFFLTFIRSLPLITWSNNLVSLSGRWQRIWFPFNGRWKEIFSSYLFVLRILTSPGYLSVFCLIYAPLWVKIT